MLPKDDREDIPTAAFAHNCPILIMDWMKSPA
ncbi:MAG: hypothetical protein CM15mP130_0620 [Verrucomicrobiota bacterium]|nr:MAG: hypothetical protein CM15mP130_0620 [Verrucomicrobiota bacterium]